MQKINNTLLLMFLIIASCSSKFNFPGKNGKSETKITPTATQVSVSVEASTAIQASAPASAATLAPAVTQAPTVADTRERCWFAVSGVQMGFPYSSPPNAYRTTFPKAKSGRPIGPGEYFDDAGGVYLSRV